MVMFRAVALNAHGEQANEALRPTCPDYSFPAVWVVLVGVPIARCTHGGMLGGVVRHIIWVAAYWAVIRLGNRHVAYTSNPSTTSSKGVCSCFRLIWLPHVRGGVASYAGECPFRLPTA